MSIFGKKEFRYPVRLRRGDSLQLQIIGEAARAMSDETHKQYPEISWRDIIDFRNLLVHEYFRIDLKLVWKIVDKEIPILRQQINLILENT